MAFFDKNSFNTNAASAEGENGFDVGLGELGDYLDARKQHVLVVHQKQIKDVVLELQQKQKQKVVKSTEKEREIVTSKKVSKETSVDVDSERASLNKEETVKQENSLSENAVEEDAVSENTNELDSQLTNKVVARYSTSIDDQKHVETNNQENRVRATGKKDSKYFGGKVGNANHYFILLKGWLNRHKDYPPELKKAKLQGIVTVRFTINLKGHLKASSIKQSSGLQLLDQAALLLLEKANPMPPIPEFFNRDSLTIALPIEYALIDE